jgi:serpin B
MGRTRIVAVLVAVVVLAAACAGGAGTAGGGGAGESEPMADGVRLIGADIERDLDPQVTDEELDALVRAQNQLGIDLYRSLTASSVSPSGNLVISPWSISTDLAMVYAGAGGRTAEEMRTVLHLDLPADRVPVVFNRLNLELESRQRDQVQIAAANKLWSAEGLLIEPAFADTMSRSYGAPVAVTDFGSDDARLAINEWVSGRTNERITDLFPTGSIDSTTKLVLVNAVHLDAQWFFPFNPDLTDDEPFTTLDGSQVTVPMMHFNEYLPTAFGGDGGAMCTGPSCWQAVELPYSGDELSMVVIVPNDLAGFEASLDASTLAAVFGSLEEGGIHLSFPRFSFGSHASLVEPLQALGMPSAFGDGADFSGMTRGGGLFIDAVEHGAFIEVDEQGTEAAAATGTAMAMSHGPTVPVTKPFLFAIRDRATDAVLFLGRVSDPSASD